MSGKGRDVAQPEAERGADTTHPRAVRPVSAEPRRDLMSSVIGVGMAAGVFSLWLAVLIIGFGLALVDTHPLLVAGLVLLSTFLHTGLFITGHDAMHGTVAPRWPALNRAVGRLVVGVYALFSFRQLLAAHVRHHRFPGQAEDPDFHAPGSPGFWAWYLRFLRHYLRWWQVVGMAVVFNLLHHGLGIPVENLLLFWVGPVIASTLQLFVFGTWLPHRGDASTHDNPHHARSQQYPAWLSLLTCYHFGLHLEHHAWPAVPWWRLPSLRDDFRGDTWKGTQAPGQES